MTTSRQSPTDIGQDDATQAVEAVATDDGGRDRPGAPAGGAHVRTLTPPPPDPLVETGPIDRPTAEPPSPDDLESLPPERPVSSAGRRTGKVRKARLRLLRVEPWSVMKSAFVLSIAIGITFVVATATLWSVVDAAGVFEVVGGLITEFTQNQDSAGVDITDYVGFSRVVGLATVIAVIDVVLLTALATLFAFLYNLSAALLGGLEVTLAEDD